MDVNSQNSRHKPQKICLPAGSFHGCAMLQNKYWSGNVGVKFYDETGTVVEAQSKDLRIPGTRIKVFETIGEIVKVCYQTESDEWQDPIITMQNRGETMLVLYEDVPPTECYK